MYGWHFSTYIRYTFSTLNFEVFAATLSVLQMISDFWRIVLTTTILVSVIMNCIFRFGLFWIALTHPTHKTAAPCSPMTGANEAKPPLSFTHKNLLLCCADLDCSGLSSPRECITRVRARQPLPHIRLITLSHFFPNVPVCRNVSPRVPIRVRFP